MKMGRNAAVLLGAALLSVLGATGAGAAGTCQSACGDRYAQCNRGGGDYGACMTTWRQCKAACATPMKGTTPAPAPKQTPMAPR